MTSVNTNSWEKKFTGQCNIAIKESEAVLYVACSVLYDRIVNRTPVGDPSLWNWPAKAGYVPGTLKASWEIMFEPSQVTIQNLQPYAYRVETGWSTQAPAGMMRVSLKEFDSIIEQVKKRMS